MEEKGKPLLDFFVCMSEAMMTITTWVIYMAPVGVFFLIGGQVLEMDDFATVAQQLGFYFGTVLIGLGIHGFIVLPIVFSICTRQLPFKFIANMTNAFTTAFGTASSTATLPVTMNLLEEKNGVDPRISRSVQHFSTHIGIRENKNKPVLQESKCKFYLLDLSCLSVQRLTWMERHFTKLLPPFSLPRLGQKLCRLER